MDIENEEQTLNFLDVTIVNNNNTGSYEFKVYRKDAITNVQIKPTSGHDPNIQRGIFIGFINRAYNICSEQNLDDEIEFLVEVFKENGYDERSLRKTVKEYKTKRTQNEEPKQDGT